MRTCSAAIAANMSLGAAARTDSSRRLALQKSQPSPHFTDVFDCSHSERAVVRGSSCVGDSAPAFSMWI